MRNKYESHYSRVISRFYLRLWPGRCGNDGRTASHAAIHTGQPAGHTAGFTSHATGRAGQPAILSASDARCLHAELWAGLRRHASTHLFRPNGCCTTGNHGTRQAEALTGTEGEGCRSEE